MASTPQQIAASIVTTGTTGYTAFGAGGATRGELVFLNFCNTTTSDITVDTELLSSSGSHFITDDLTIPAKGVTTWQGMVTLNTAGQVIYFVPSANGVDVTGTVVENA